MFESVKNFTYVGMTYSKEIGCNIPTYAMRREMGVECPHSDSCFACPLPDCKIDGTRAVRCNLLPTDREIKEVCKARRG